MRCALSSPAIRFPSPNRSRLASSADASHLFLRRASTASTPSPCLPPLRRSSTAGAPHRHAVLFLAAPPSSSLRGRRPHRRAVLLFGAPASSSLRLHHRQPHRRAVAEPNLLKKFSRPLCVSRDPADWKPPVRISCCFQSMSSNY
uniref:Uncharacterized protein n=1 Tax=Oryza glumipatula TaxID=40148 RepID=A0A0E0BLY4_9ORYZ